MVKLEEYEALQHRLALYQQLSSLYPLEQKHLQQQIEVLLLLQQNDEAELLTNKLYNLLTSKGLHQEAEKVQYIRTHLNKSSHCNQLYSTPFLHLASSSFLEKAFRKHRRIEVSEGDYLIHYGEKSSQMYILAQGELAILSRDENGEKHLEHTMQAGEVIGELAFLDQAPRTADVIATKTSTVLAIPSKAVIKLFVENPDIEAALRKEATTRKIQMDMKNSLALAKLPRDIQCILAKQGHYIHYKPLERIYRSEQTIQTVDLICHGYVRLVGEMHDGSSLVLNSLKKGTLLGCAGAVPQMSEHYIADIVSMDEVTMISFPLNFFKKVADANPRLYQAVVQEAELEQGSLLQTINKQNSLI